MPQHIEKAIAELEHCITIVRQNSCESAALRLEGLLEQIRGTNAYERKEALFQVGGLCDPKALGDLYIKSMSWQEWFSQLDRLHDASARAHNELDRHAT